MYDHFEFMGWGGFMGLVWIVLLVVVLVMLAGVFRQGGDGLPKPTAREILDRRYANGEIDHDEYQRRLSDLEQ